MTIKGYARVSTDGQTLDGQHALLKEAGAERVFSEKISGATRDRPALERCLGSLSPGDTVLVTKLDRLARSTRDLLNVLALIADFGASFKSLGDPWADTTTPHGRLMLTVLGGLAEFERHLILSRTAEGRSRAKARGIKFGRKPKLTAYQRVRGQAAYRAGRNLDGSGEVVRGFAYDDCEACLNRAVSVILKIVHDFQLEVPVILVGTFSCSLVILGPRPAAQGL